MYELPWSWKIHRAPFSVASVSVETEHRFYFHLRKPFPSASLCPLVTEGAIYVTNIFVVFRVLGSGATAVQLLPSAAERPKFDPLPLTLVSPASRPELFSLSTTVLNMQLPFLPSSAPSVMHRQGQGQRLRVQTPDQEWDQGGVCSRVWTPGRDSTTDQR